MPAVYALAFAGSLRKESWNKKLLRLAIEAAREAGLEVREFDLCHVPLYNADVEAAGRLSHTTRALSLPSEPAPAG